MFTNLKNKLAPLALAVGLATAAYAPSVLADKPHTTVQVKDVKDGKTTYGLTTKREITVPSNIDLDDVVGLPQLVTPVGMPDGATLVTMARGVTLPGSATPVGLSYAATPVTITKTITTHVPTPSGLPEFDVGASYGILGDSSRGISNAAGLYFNARWLPAGRNLSLGVEGSLYSANASVNGGQVVKDAKEGPLAGSLKLTEKRTSDAELSGTALGITLQNTCGIYAGENFCAGFGVALGGINKKTTWNETITTEKSIDGVVMQGANGFDRKGGVDESTSPYLKIAIPFRFGSQNGYGVCVTPSAMMSTEGDQFYGINLGLCRGSVSKK
jgi:hypothetical protein